MMEISEPGIGVVFSGSVSAGIMLEAVPPGAPRGPRLQERSRSRALLPGLWPAARPVSGRSGTGAAVSTRTPQRPPPATGSPRLSAARHTGPIAGRIRRPASAGICLYVYSYICLLYHGVLTCHLRSWLSHGVMPGAGPPSRVPRDSPAGHRSSCATDITDRAGDVDARHQAVCRAAR